MKNWIDFKALRRDLDFEQVLRHYGVELNIRATDKGRQHSGPCPLKTCKSGRTAKKVFSASLDRGIWQCFFCKEHGNVLDLVVLLEGLDRSKGEDVRKAAKIATERFIKQGAKPTIQPEEPSKIEESKGADIPPPAKTLVNEPLDFTLQSLDGSHEWFGQNGINEKTVEHFGLGFCNRGWLKGRIAIPLRRADGKVIGYAGRLHDEKMATPENPLYLFPEPRIHKGIQYEFRRSDFLYNGHSIQEPVPRLLVTTSIDMVWLLWQHEHANTVSLMGEDCHSKQRTAILSMVNTNGVIGVVAEENAQIGEFVHQLVLCRTVRWYVKDSAPSSLLMDIAVFLEVLK